MAKSLIHLIFTLQAKEVNYNILNEIWQSKWTELAFRSEFALLHLPLLSTSNPPSHLTSQTFRPERDSILLHLNRQAFYKILHSKIQDNYPPPRFSRFQSVASRLALHNVHSQLFWVMPLDDDVVSISDDEDAIYISDGEDGFQSPRKSQSSLCAASWWPPSITKQNFKMKIPFALSRELSTRPSRS